MEDLCCACLCRGRKLFNINDSGFAHIYTDILNEIQVYNIYINIQICWECKAIVRKFNNFKQQVKNSYLELIQCIEGGDKTRILFLSQEPHLKIEHVSSQNIPDIKIEDDGDNDIINDYNNGTVETYDFVKMDEEGLDNDCLNTSDEVVKVEQREKFNDGGDTVKSKKERRGLEKTPKEKKKSKAKTKLKSKKDLKIKSKRQKPSENVLDKDLDYDYEDDLPLNREVDEERDGNTEREKKTDNLENKYGVYEEIVTDELTISKVPARPNGVKAKQIQTIPKEKTLRTDPSGKPECAECGKVFSSKKTLRYHLNVLHKGNNRYPCPRCGKVYQWKSNLGRHLRSHKARDTGELYCETCDKRFASVATYRQHLSISKQHVSENEFSHTCSECGKKFVSKTRLRDHIDWEHLQKIKFKCQLCNKPFKCHTSLYVHMKNVHRNKGLKDNLCHVCGKSYQNRAKLRYHIVAMHTTETPYQCEQCHAAFGWYSSLYRHVREVHYKMKVHPPKSKKPKKRVDPIPAVLAPHALPSLPMPPVGPPLTLLDSLTHS